LLSALQRAFNFLSTSADLLHGPLDRIFRFAGLLRFIADLVILAARNAGAILLSSTRTLLALLGHAALRIMGDRTTIRINPLAEGVEREALNTVFPANGTANASKIQAAVFEGPLCGD
jgi:hypothetical protein